MASVKFRISSGLKSIIGRDLITNDFVAIFELVKNSFDAKATHVKVVFDLDRKETAAIYVVDNGKGMSASDVENKWLFVAYSAKKDGEEDLGERRVYAGSKGVGRFSCDRLGRKLFLQSKARTENSVNTIRVDWGAFEKKPKKEFGSVDIDYETAPAFSGRSDLSPASGKNGTVLKITELREYASWTREKLLKLKRSLQKLLDPFDGTISGRKLELVCSRETKADQKADRPEKRINGVVSNNIFSRFLATSTVVQSELKDDEIITTLTDRGVLIFRIAEEVKTRLPELASCSVKCDIGYLNKATKASFTRTMGIDAVQYGSVFLVHNGFRVYPVGEEMDDFWGLNRRKQQGYSRYIGTREVLGCVRVEDPNTVFQEASNREGLVISPAVEMLRDFVIFAVRRLEAYLNRVTWKDPNDKENLEPESLDKDETRSRIIRLVRDMAVSRRIRILDYNRDLITILHAKSESYGESLADLRSVAEKTKDATLLHKVDLAAVKFKKLQQKLHEQQQQTQDEQNARQKAETAAAAARDEARRNRTAYDEEKKRNVLLISEQSRGTEFYECFIHDIAGDLKTARMSLEDILTEFRKVYSQSSGFADGLFDLMEQIEHMQSLARFAISGNFRFDAEEVEGDLVKFFQVYVDRIARTCHRLVDITFSSLVDVAEAKFRPAGLSVVIDNLVGNAHKAESAKISFSLSDGGDFWRIDVEDDGRGLDPSADVSQIFEKGYTRTEGSGLGLYFCRKMLDDMQGSIVVASGKRKRGVAFTIRIPKK